MAELLNLSTVVERETINIVSKLHPKGKRYTLASSADLGPYEYAVIVNRNSEFQQLKDAKKLTAAQERRANDILDELTRLVCRGVEPSVFQALTSEQKQMIFATWSVSLADTGAAEGKTRSRRTTAASSPGSKRSTAATRKPGSTTRRGS